MAPSSPLPALTRRAFLRVSGGSTLLVLAAGLVATGCPGEARGWRLLLSDPALCGGCRRCAITCSALRAGGPGAAWGLVDPDRHVQALQFSSGEWFANTCRMCPEAWDDDGRLREPRCVAVCLRGAAQIAAPGHPIYGDSRVRFIDESRCNGCGACARHCPHFHPLLREGLSRKCDLCIGQSASPPCVDACPASSLQVLDVWSDEPLRPFAWTTEGSVDGTGGGGIEG